jgi:hypothetical protein
MLPLLLIALAWLVPVVVVLAACRVAAAGEGAPVTTGHAPPRPHGSRAPGVAKRRAGRSHSPSLQASAQ